MNKLAIILFFILLFSSCAVFKNPLPKTIPANIEFSYGGGNDMSRYYEGITLSFNKGKYELNQGGKKDSLIFSIDSSDIKNLYILFRKYRIDQIKNRKPAHITYDASREGISINFNNISYNVISGANFPFATYEDKIKYTTLKKAIYNIYHKYKNKP